MNWVPGKSLTLRGLKIQLFVVGRRHASCLVQLFGRFLVIPKPFDLRIPRTLIL